MSYTSDMQRVAFVGDYLPRQCGIATFTYDLRGSVSSYSELDCPVVAVNDRDEGYSYPSEVRFEIAEQDRASYRRAADFLNFSNIDVVSVQHEFGIYGGEAGSHLLTFLRDLRVPFVTTHHTVLHNPNIEQRHVMQEMAEMASRMVVMTERGKRFLTDIYNVDPAKIDLIPHGIPDMPFVDPNFYKDKFDVEGKHVLLTFGLLSPNKGIEHVLNALPAIVEQYPNLVYIVLGATHPNLRKSEGESYRLSLERLAQQLGVQRNVIFYDRFVSLNELTEFIAAADLYITPYMNAEQIVSGTLAYSFGCGKAVISTPYWHATELLDEDRGVLVPFGSSRDIAKEVLTLLGDDTRRHAMRKRAYLHGRSMIWSEVAKQYIKSFEHARHNLRIRHVKPFAVRTLEEKRIELPPVKLDHVKLLTDSTGMFQHATFNLPNYSEGYCTDDNVRALLLMVQLESLGHDPKEVQRLASTYAAFINYAYNPELKRFRNFMSYDRRWLEEAGSDDSHGRSVWALGACLGRSKNPDLRMWAARLFELVLPPVMEMTSPRAWAFTLLGIREYFRRFGGDRLAGNVRDVLTNKLMAIYEASATEDWPWFEHSLTYENAVMSHALLVSGRSTERADVYETGIKTLQWLLSQQTAPAGHFRPIGSNGFYTRGGSRADFDQQPIEAFGTMSACLEAYRSTGQTKWYEHAHTCFEWFIGKNDLGLSVYDLGTGACGDGLQMDRINLNRGAESTLAFLLARSELGLYESSVDTHPSNQYPTEAKRNGNGHAVTIKPNRIPQGSKVIERV
jgi:glycosyltransferase involved in cell wall biosynthesis